VLAIGIMAFVVSVIVGLLMVSMNSSRDNRDREEILNALPGLRTFIQSDVPFDTVFGWAVSGTSPDVLGVSYRGNLETGAPDRGSTTVLSVWFLDGSPPAGLSIAALEGAREGSWIKGRLRFDSSLTPGGESLTATAADFEYARLVFFAELAVVGDPAVAADPSPRERFPIVVTR
jgi:hypothetical protein